MIDEEKKSLPQVGSGKPGESHPSVEGRSMDSGGSILTFFGGDIEVNPFRRRDSIARTPPGVSKERPERESKNVEEEDDITNSISSLYEKPVEIVKLMPSLDETERNKTVTQVQPTKKRKTCDTNSSPQKNSEDRVMSPIFKKLIDKTKALNSFVSVTKNVHKNIKSWAQEIVSLSRRCMEEYKESNELRVSCEANMEKYKKTQEEKYKEIEKKLEEIVERKDNLICDKCKMQLGEYVATQEITEAGGDLKKFRMAEGRLLQSNKDGKG